MRITGATPATAVAVVVMLVMLCSCMDGGLAWGQSLGVAHGGPVILRHSDRMGFVRPRKVGSTLATHFLFRGMNLCVNMCASKDYCMSCVFRYCQCKTREDVFGTPGCYGCPHQPPWAIHKRYVKEMVNMLNHTMNEAERRVIVRSKLYLITLMREPTKRVLSHYFYLRQGLCLAQKPNAILQRWLECDTPELRAQFCNATVESFLKFVASPCHRNEVTRLFLGDKKSIELDQLYDTAVEILQEMPVVMISENMTESLLLLDYTIRRPGNMCNFRHTANLTSDLEAIDAVVKLGHTNRTPPNAFRLELESNATVLAAIREHNRYDESLYTLAKQRFQDDFAKMRSNVLEGNTCQRRPHN
eukprot:m.93765 g.93765  ORF g.93765 m.93765 type:complete len:359 (+) comp15385_c0_seq2:373-1449(+)